MWWGTFDFGSKYDWGRDYERPQHKLKDLIIYEMTVRCFTASKSSGLSQDKRGTYLGVAEKVRLFGVLFWLCSNVWPGRHWAGAQLLLVHCQQELRAAFLALQQAGAAALEPHSGSGQ
jgi:hypothetical protein